MTTTSPAPTPASLYQQLKGHLDELKLADAADALTRPVLLEPLSTAQARPGRAETRRRRRRPPRHPGPSPGRGLDPHPRPGTAPGDRGQCHRETSPRGPVPVREPAHRSDAEQL